MTTPPARWLDFRRHTPARVALGRAGNAQPTAAHLDFQQAHAAARDAVHAALNVEALREALGTETIQVSSAAPDRRTYLLRPDLGRRLAEGEVSRLPSLPGCFALVICDGLSATAIQRHAAPFVRALLPALTPPLAPIIIATQGRVALGDPIGEALGAEAVCVLIGERPGLTSPDSMGAYLTWRPRRGRTDAERNCISNIRPDGLPPATAAAKLVWLIAEMRRLRLTGVRLKDEEPRLGSGSESLHIE